MRHALIVDDEPAVLEWMAEVARAEGYTVATAGSLRQARAELVRQQPEVLLTDLQLPDGEGTELLADLDALMQTEVVVMTGRASTLKAIDVVRTGATDYVAKPVQLGRLLSILRRQPQANELKTEIGELRQELRRAGRFGRMLGVCSAMQSVYDKLSRVAPTSATVLLVGEPGTGKALAARTIHDLSRRRRAPFLSVNCAVSSPQSIESELFGHEKGSFPGAERHHRGFFERAHGGTIFIDQICDMPLDLQHKLLRVMESALFSKLGGEKAMVTDVRLICSTSKDLAQMVATGAFRDDLYSRLSAFPVQFPALRERAEDLDMLAQHFLDRLNRAEGTRKTFAPDALAAMNRRDWPGNVRELETFVHRIYMLSDDIIHSVAPPEGRSAEHDGNVLTIRLGTPLDEVERRVTMATLERCGHVKRTAAEVLGISLKTLYNRLEAYAARSTHAPSEHGGHSA